MVALSRIDSSLWTSTTGSGTALSPTFQVRPTKNSYCLVAVSFSVSTFSVSSIVPASSTPGTFVQAASITSANRKLELWVGYGFNDATGASFTLTRSAGAGNAAMLHKIIDVYADCSQAPTIAASTGNTGTGTSADSGSLTPAVGDILFAGLVIASTSADSTARTHTGHAYLENAGIDFSNIRTEAGWADAISTTSSKEVWTIGSAEYAAIQAKITPVAAPTASAALLLKGRLTAADDAAEGG